MVRVLDDVRCDDADNNTITETTTHNWLSLSKFFCLFAVVSACYFRDLCPFWLFSLIHYLLHSVHRVARFFTTKYWRFLSVDPSKSSPPNMSIL